MDLYCGKCRFMHTCADGLKCRIYNSNLSSNSLETLRLQKCKFENSKAHVAPEKK